MINGHRFSFSRLFLAVLCSEKRKIKKLMNFQQV
jgi:hypothetical protein